MTVKKVVLFSIIGFIITASIFASVFYFAANDNPEKKVKEIKTFTYSIGGLYSNLKDSKKILKINIVLETTDEKINEKIDAKKSKLNNNILELLRSKTEAELVGDIGQQSLRKEVLGLTKAIFPSDKINNVYFIEFIIQ